MISARICALLVFILSGSLSNSVFTQIPQDIKSYTLKDPCPNYKYTDLMGYDLYSFQNAFQFPRCEDSCTADCDLFYSYKVTWNIGSQVIKFCNDDLFSKTDISYTQANAVCNYYNVQPCDITSDLTCKSVTSYLYYWIFIPIGAAVLLTIIIAVPIMIMLKRRRRYRDADNGLVVGRIDIYTIEERSPAPQPQYPNYNYSPPPPIQNPPPTNYSAPPPQPYA